MARKIIVRGFNLDLDKIEKFYNDTDLDKVFELAKLANSGFDEEALDALGTLGRFRYFPAYAVVDTITGIVLPGVESEVEAEIARNKGLSVIPRSILDEAWKINTIVYFKDLRHLRRALTNVWFAFRDANMKDVEVLFNYRGRHEPHTFGFTSPSGNAYIEFKAMMLVDRRCVCKCKLFESI